VAGLLTRAERVSAYLGNQATRALVYGESDCCLFAADWVCAETGIDPAKHLRGRYRTEAECLRLLAAGGGLEAVVSAAMTRCGFVRTIRPSIGDVGLVRAPVFIGGSARFGVVGAIRARVEWVVRRSDGLEWREFAAAMAWTI